MLSRYVLTFTLLMNVSSGIMIAASSKSSASASSSSSAAAAAAAVQASKINLGKPFSCIVKVHKKYLEWSPWKTFDSIDMRGTYESVVERLLKSVEAVVAPGTPPGSPRTGKPMNAYNARESQRQTKLYVERRWHLPDGVFSDSEGLEIEIGKDEAYKKWFEQAKAFLTDPTFLAKHPAAAKPVTPFKGLLQSTGTATAIKASSSPSASS